MNLSTRDRRALMLLGVAVVLILIMRFGIYGDSSQQVVAVSDSVPQAENRLARLRELAATVPGKETMLKKVQAELVAREKGILATETAAQAQARIQEIARSLAKKEGIEIRGADLGAVRPLADDYGQVDVSVSFQCRIEQLVNFLADLASEKELISTSDLHISAANQKDKTIMVRLGLSGVVPRNLVPRKTGAVSF